MRITVDEITFEDKYNDISEFDLFWRKITKEFYEKDLVIQFIEINEQKIINDFEKYIVENFNYIQQLKIYTISEHQLLMETLEETSRYLSDVVCEIESVSEIFYGEIKGEDWKRFSDFTQGLEWIYMTMQSCIFLMNKHSIDTDARKEKLVYLKEKFESTIQELDKVLNSKDFISVGDIIDYEFKPLLIELKQLLISVRVN